VPEDAARDPEVSGRGVLRVIEGGQLGFWCPGCECMHVVTSGWAFDGNYEKPTFTPSVLVRGGHHASDWKGPDCWCTWYPKNKPDAVHKFVCGICHSFVRNGNIEFLSDCTHALAGKTVPLEPL
jgi:hypothetical protein